VPDKKILDRLSLRGAALPNPDYPFLISPLPQFTTPLTTSNILPFSSTLVPPLPDLTDDLEGDDDEVADSEDETATLVTAHQPQLQRPNGPKRDPVLQQLSFRRTDGRPEPESALSRTGPYLDHRRARSGSTPTIPTSRTSPLSANESAETADASPPSPPKSATLSQPQPRPLQHVSSSRDADAPLPTRSGLPQNRDGGVLRTRLHDLLRDSAMSSSLPNMSASHFPPSFANRETSSGRVSPPPSRSDPSNTNKTPLPSSLSSDIAGPLSQTSTNKPLSAVVPNCSSAPRQGFSSASTEAKKLEEERRRKLREERQNSQLEKSANDNMDREAHMSKQLSTSTISTHIIQPITRREQPSTGTNSLMVSYSGSTSSTRRGQSSTGILGRSGSSMPPSQEEHDPSTHQSRYASIGKARGAIFSSVDPAGIYA